MNQQCKKCLCQIQPPIEDVNRINTPPACNGTLAGQATAAESSYCVSRVGRRAAVHTQALQCVMAHMEAALVQLIAPRFAVSRLEDHSRPVMKGLADTASPGSDT
jgi:hypothetical protein